jgi:type IV secretory pathway TraG/TraD family ATPase VirD4
MMVKFKTTRFATKKFVPLKWLFIVMTLAFLVFAGWQGYQRYQLVQKQLITLGWKTELKTTQAQFLVTCVKDTECRNQIRNGMTGAYLLWLVPALFGVFVVVFLSGYESHRLTNKPVGMAHWATAQNMKDWLKNKDNLGYLGLTKTGKMLTQNRNERNEGVAIVGKPGARKTSGMMRQNILRDIQAGASIAIVDIKYPESQGGLLEALAWAKAHDLPCHVFTPYANATKVLPVLEGGENPDRALEIAQTIYAKRAGESGDAGHHRSVGTLVLSNLVAYNARYGQGSVGDILRFIDQTGFDPDLFRDSIQQLEASERIMGIGPFFRESPSKQAEILMGLAARLQIWADSRLDYATRVPENKDEILDFDGLGREPGVWYFGLPQAKSRLESGRGMLRLLFQAINRAFEVNAGKSGGVLPIATSWYLDELMNFGHLGDDIGEMFNTIRGRGVAVYSVFQNRSAGEALYGSAAFNGFFETIGTKVWFPAKLTEEDKRYLCAALGSTTAIDNGNSSRSEAKMETARLLLAPEECMHLPIEMGIVQSSRPPAQVYLPRLDEKEIKGLPNKLYRDHQKMKYEGDLVLLAQLLAKSPNKGADANQKVANEEHALEVLFKKIVELNAPVVFHEEGLLVTIDLPVTATSHELLFFVGDKDWVLTDDGFACLKPETQEALHWLGNHGALLREAIKSNRVEQQNILLDEEIAKKEHIATGELQTTRKLGTKLYKFPIPTRIGAYT